MGKKPKTPRLFVTEKEKIPTRGEKWKVETNDSPGFVSLPRGVQFRGSGSTQQLITLPTIEEIANTYIHYLLCQNSLQFDHSQARVW